MYTMYKKKCFPMATRTLSCLLAVVALYIMAAPLGAAAGQLPDLIPVGHTVGVRLHVDGVVVTELSAVDTSEGSRCPAREAGLMPGDTITHVEKKAVSDYQSLKAALEKSGGKAVTLRVRREGQMLSLALTPVRASDGSHRLGALIRDNMAGIGTVTFYDPRTGQFGALGHCICDAQSRIPPFDGGAIYDATVKEIIRGAVGKPGELRGEFASRRSIGPLLANTDEGIFGLLEDPSLIKDAALVPTAAASEMRTGPAVILANVQGDVVRCYDIEILKIYAADAPNHRHFMLKVTDPELLELTGGIVQGMSGSPVLQNGKLVGAVTHVLVGDPKRGYGLFIESMIDAGNACLPTLGALETAA